MAKHKVHSGSRHRRSRSYNNNNQRDRERDNSNRQLSGKPKSGGFQQQSFLPAPSVLQEYEYATEGAADRILEMAEREQERRNKWEDEYLKFHKKSLRIGQLFGFLLLVFVVYATVMLAENGYERVAEVLAASSFISVALVSIFSNRGNNRYPRKPRR